MGRVLERAAAVGSGRLSQEAALRAQTAVKFLHRVDWIAEMFESVVRLEHSHFTDAKGRAPVEFDDDLSPVEIGQP